MQNNFLSNYCLFYCTMDTAQCYKALSLISTMNIQRLSPKEIEYATYEGRREVKQSVRSKEKSLRTEFDLTVLRQEDVMFMYNREKGSDPKAGNMTISSLPFFDIMQRNRLIGDITHLKTVHLVIESIIWEGYIISHLEFGGKSLLIIQEVFSSTLFTLNREEALAKKTRQLFEPLLELILGAERSALELDTFQKELRTMKALHPEVQMQIDKEKGVAETNYCLIYYLSIMQAVQGEGPRGG